MADLTPQEIESQLAQQSLEIKYILTVQMLRDELRTLKATVDERWSHFKMIVAAVSIILPVVGTLIGMHSWDEAKSQMNAKIDKNIQDTNEFYGDIMASSVLFSQHRYDDVIPKLTKWFDNGHTYDKNILIPLLASLNIRDDWAEARPIIYKLRADPKKFDEINDASIYAIIGSIEVQLGITELGKGALEADRDMQQGDKLLNRAYYMATENQNEIRKIILTNQWLYHIAKGEFNQSGQNILSIKNLPREVGVYSWDAMKKWSCMASLAQRDHDNSMRRAEQQWAELRSRYL